MKTITFEEAQRFVNKHQKFVMFDRFVTAQATAKTITINLGGSKMVVNSANNPECTLDCNTLTVDGYILDVVR